jgi:pyrimidine-specific ribonucleoside hydrolase
VTIPLLIDCDPGIDDAVAVLLACASPEVSLLGLTTVAGNVGLPHTTRNARRLLALAGREDVPVAAGADRALVRASPGRAVHVPGPDGVHRAELPEPTVPVDPRTAVDLMADTVRGSADPVTLVAIGPLTNVALFYAVHPGLAARLGRVVVMGGSAGAGNASAAAEFNVWSDPEAAYRVLTDPGLPRAVPTTMIGLELTETVPLTAADLDLLADGGPSGRACARMLAPEAERRRREGGRGEPAVHDAVAVASVLAPALLETVPAAVTVDCSADAGRGTTRVGPAPDGSSLVVAVGAQRRTVLDMIVHRVSDYQA